MFFSRSFLFSFFSIFECNNLVIIIYFFQKRKIIIQRFAYTIARIREYYGFFTWTSPQQASFEENTEKIEEENEIGQVMGNESINGCFGIEQPALVHVLRRVNNLDVCLPTHSLLKLFKRNSSSQVLKAYSIALILLCSY